MSSAQQSWLDRHHFALRRLHSLSGIIPIGAFLINHLLANSTAFLGEEAFNHHIGLIHSLPWLLGIEILFIWAPLAFHGAYGTIIALQGRSNALQYPYMDNWRYTLQRVTAWITVAFVLLHLAHFRFGHWFGLPEYASAEHTIGFFAFTREGFLSCWIPLWSWMVIYAIGTAAAVYHFCNGIVTFCITWGFIIGEKSRQRLSVAAAGIGVVLLLWGAVSLYGLARMDHALDKPAPAAAVAVVPGG